MEDIQSIAEIAQQIGLTVINDDRKYWLVRTKGGRFFDEFYFEGYIAIGWNIITQNQLKPKKPKSDDLEELKTVLKETLQKNKEIKVPGYPAGQIIRFAFEMKKVISFLFQTKTQIT